MRSTKGYANLRPGGALWTAAQDAALRRLYADHPTVEVARHVGRTVSSCNYRAYRLGLHKSAAYLAGPSAHRWRPGRRSGGEDHRFKKGLVPWNKGRKHPKGWAPGRMAETQFKKGSLSGRAAARAQPIGAERVTDDGYRQRKVNNDLPFYLRWRGVHLLVWEAAHGPVPPGHAVAFVNGDKTDIRLENLTLISRQALMGRNTVHNLPAPLPQVIQLLGALNRKTKRASRHGQEQDR